MPSLWSLAILGALMVAGLTGALGGQEDQTRRAQGNGVILKVKTPAILRSGMLFETVVEVRTERPVTDLVVAVSDGLWRQMTINTMIPAAEEESSENGFRRFSFGPAPAGETFRFKVDGQINPPLFVGTRGDVAILDGDRELARTPLRTRVLP